MPLRHHHYQRFSEASIWLTLCATATSAFSIAVPLVRGQEMVARLYDLGGRSVADPLAVTGAAWLAACVCAGLATVFMIGRSLRLGAGAALTALTLGLAGVLFAGYGSNLNGLRSSLGFRDLGFADPAHRWQLGLIWSVPALLLAIAAALAIIDYVQTTPTGRGGDEPSHQREPTPGNEALHWHGSTCAGIDARSDARDRL